MTNTISAYCRNPLMERRLSVKILILTVLLPCVKIVAESHVGDSITCTETECDENEHEDGGVARQTFLEEPVQKAKVELRILRRYGMDGCSLILSDFRILCINN